VKLVFARHGESEYSALSLLNGDLTVPCGLTALGVAQARALGDALADEPLELCVTTGFQRVEETADEALRGRGVPRLVEAGLADPRYGSFEGRPLAEFRAWASRASSADVPGPGGESRHAIAERYARSFRLLLARPEESILVVAHSLPVAYALGARDGVPPGTNMPIVEHAKPYPFASRELERATGLLERWTAAPTW
jgi:2,3-bisphosphoglycerate-dependent phosphoglycerate mutase